MKIIGQIKSGLINYKIGNIMRLFKNFKSYIGNKKELTYFTNEVQKSKWRIFFDQMRLIFKYGYVEDYYYHYGHDLLSAKMIDDFILEPVHIKILSEANDYPYGKKAHWEKMFNYKALVRDKYLFSLMMDAYNLPSPKTFGFIKNNMFFVQKDKKSIKIDELNNYDMDVMLKPTTGNGGIGMIHITIKNGIIYKSNRVISIEDLRKLINSKEMYLVQEYVSKQHPDMVSLFPNSLNTLRVTMVRDEKGIVHLLGVMALMGVGDMIVSNWHYGGIIINVNNDGYLNEYGYSLSLKRIDRHPETGVVFKEFKVPFYNEIIDVCTNAMELFYGLKSIGWDMAITPDGPIFIEGNDMWGLPAHQMVERRGWRHYYKDFFSYNK